MILDLLATNNWERPVYFAITVGDDNYLGLQDYFQLEGLAYRLVPTKDTSPESMMRSKSQQDFGWVNTEIMYDNMMNKFKWGGVDKQKLYMDENNIRMTMNLRSNFDRLAQNLIREGKKDKAIKVLDYCFKVLPENNVPYNYFVIQLADAYYKAGETAKSDKILTQYATTLQAELNWYLSQKSAVTKDYSSEIERSYSIYRYLMDVVRRNKRDQLSKKLGTGFSEIEMRVMSLNGDMFESRQ
jgi:tetratricopeptide (TPR) repeat protein